MKRTIRRLMFITDAGSFGGAERYLLDMAAAAERRGIEPHICWLPPEKDSQSPFTPNDPAATFLNSQFSILNSYPSLLTSPLRTFLQHLRTFHPHALIINASGRPGFWLSCWLAKVAGVPFAWVHHMVEQRDPRSLPPQWFRGTVEGPQWWRVPQALRHRLAAGAADAVITSTEADRDRIARWHCVPRPAISVIPPGVDCARFQFDPTGRRAWRARWQIEDDHTTNAPPFVIGTAVRLVERKGIEPLIEATARLRAQGIPAIAAIAGDGPERDRFARLAQARGIAPCVHFTGFVPDMPAFHSAVDVFALCSETESFGLALAEAMACDRPAVATPTSGGRAQIRHNENGWLLQGFTAVELSEALAALYRDAPLRERLARNARAGVQARFSIDRTLERTLHALRAPDAMPDVSHMGIMPEA